MNEPTSAASAAAQTEQRIDAALHAADRQREQAAMANPLAAARRSVLRNPKSYLSFILALFLIQALLCMLLSAAALDVRNTKEEILTRYDYDLLLRDLTQPEYAVLHNLVQEIPEEFLGSEVVPYTAIRYERTESGGYNVYITLRGDDVALEAQQLQEAFLRAVAAVNDGIVVSYSPLYNYHAYIDQLNAQTCVSVLLLLLLATFLLVMLQRTRLNHEKYQYGIYMAFGAGYRQLFAAAAGELLFVVLLTALPALLVGNLATLLLCIGTGKPYVPSVMALIMPFLLTLLISWISVRFPTRIMASRTPLELLSARDNSNLVTSPRRSLHVFGRSFPFTYELFSLWRYRRYLASLLLFTMLFASLWLGLVRIANFNTAKENTRAPEYTVTFNPEVPNAELLNENVEELAGSIEWIDGVQYCDYQISSAIMDYRAFMAVSEKASRGAGRFVVHSRPVTGDAYPYATNAVRYVAYQEASIDRLVARAGSIDGDPYAVLEDDRNIILSTALHNTVRFDFEVGDTVLLATNLMTKTSAIMATNNLDLLRYMLDEEEFALQEYTVCAVIRDEESDGMLNCGMNHATYRALTGIEPYTTSLHVYLEEDANFDTLQVVDEEVQLAAAEYYTTRVITHNDLFDRYLSSFRNLSARIVTAAYFLLAMMPLFSFFSQRVFYKKRVKEWFILKTLGGQRRDRKLLLVLSGVVLSAVNFITMLPAGLLADYLAFKMCNDWLPAGGFLTSALMHYRLSPLIVPILLLFALLCGLLPCLLECYYVSRAMKQEDEMEAQLAAERAAYQIQRKEADADVSEKE